MKSDSARSTLPETLYLQIRNALRSNLTSTYRCQIAPLYFKRLLSSQGKAELERDRALLESARKDRE